MSREIFGLLAEPLKKVLAFGGSDGCSLRRWGGLLLYLA